jgi:hypothetical protein
LGEWGGRGARLSPLEVRWLDAVETVVGRLLVDGLDIIADVFDEDEDGKGVDT